MLAQSGIGAGEFWGGLASLFGSLGLLVFAVARWLRAETGRAEKRLDARIDKAEERLQAGIDKAEERLQAGIVKAEERLQAGIDKAEERLQAGIDKAEERLQAGIDKAEERLQAGIDKAEERLQIRIDVLEQTVSNSRAEMGELRERTRWEAQALESIVLVAQRMENLQLQMNDLVASVRRANDPG